MTVPGTDVLLYILAALAGAYGLLFALLGAWVYKSTRAFRLSPSFGIYDYVKQNNKLSPGQQLLLEYLSILGHLVLACAVLVLIFDTQGVTEALFHD